jgi:hypothetical protein
MKHLLRFIFILFAFLLFAFGSFAQKSDTLTIPVGKYQFIKVGDKVYKLITTLEEVKPEPKLDSTSNFIYKPFFPVPNGTYPLIETTTDYNNPIIKQQ